MKAKLFIIIVVCISIFASSLFSLRVLQIEALREEKVLFACIVHPGDKFATKFIHSVEKSPVWEFFKIDEGFRLILYETTFSSCNTGLPCMPCDEENFTNEGGRFRLSNMFRIFPKLLLWVNEEYDNTLMIHDSHTISLPSLAGNTLLQITICRMPIYKFLYVKMAYCLNQI